MNLTQISQRLANLTQQFQQMLSSAKRIEELPEQDSLVASSRIHVSNAGTSQSLEIQKIIEAANNLAFNRLLFVGDFILNGNILTIPEMTEWLIENQTVQHIESIDFNIPFSAVDKVRRDVIFGNESGEILKQTGLEILDEGIEPPKPNIPPNTVEITSFLVTDSEIGVPDSPIINGDYLTKLSRRDLSFGVSGTNVYLPPPFDYNGYRLINGGLVSIAGIDDSFLPNSNIAVIGDLYPITNAKPSPVTLIDSASFITGNLILTSGKVALMRYEGQGVYRLVSTSQTSGTLQSVTTSGNITDRPLISTLAVGYALDAQASIRTLGFIYGNTFEGTRLLLGGGGSGSAAITSSNNQIDFNTKSKYLSNVGTTFTDREIPDVQFNDTKYAKLLGQNIFSKDNNANSSTSAIIIQGQTNPLLNMRLNLDTANNLAEIQAIRTGVDYMRLFVQQEGGSFIVGTDISGTEKLRVGSGARFHGYIVLGKFTDGTEPSLETGKMYYNTSIGKFKFGEATGWKVVTTS